MMTDSFLSANEHFAMKTSEHSLTDRILSAQNFLSPGELDPLNRRQIREDKPDVVVQGTKEYIDFGMYRSFIAY